MGLLSELDLFDTDLVLYSNVVDYIDEANIIEKKSLNPGFWNEWGYSSDLISFYSPERIMLIPLLNQDLLPLQVLAF